MTLEEAGGEENLREKINIVSYWINKIRYFILKQGLKTTKKEHSENQKRPLKITNVVLKMKSSVNELESKGEEKPCWIQKERYKKMRENMNI